jgi:hypothetical protein
MGEKAKPKIFTLLRVSLLSLFLLVRTFFVTPVFSDEVIYINMAKAVAKGLLPYKDFFYAHPPLQLFLHAFLFKLLGFDFLIPKLFVLFLNFFSLILICLISQKVFKDKTCLASIFFLFFPVFLLFADQANGCWESLFFLLISFIFLVEENNLLFSLFFTFSVFFRYFSLAFLPFFLFYLKLKRRSIKPIFFSIILIFVTFFLIYSIFGFEFLKDTILYHFAKVSPSQALKEQYLTIGFFTSFLSLINLYFGIKLKNKFLILFAVYPLLYDLSITFLLGQVIYHYYIFSLPFVFIALGFSFSKGKFFIAKILIISVLVFSVLGNVTSIKYYFNKENFMVFENVSIFFKGKSGKIFGDPILSNYVSFKLDIPISGHIFDSDPKHIKFEEMEVKRKLMADMPNFLILTDLSYFFPLQHFFEENYIKISEIGNYQIYEMKKV